MQNRREFDLRLLVATETGSFDDSGSDSSSGSEADSARRTASFETMSSSCTDGEVSGPDLSVRLSIDARRKLDSGCPVMI